MRTEKLELDETFENEYAGCYVFQEISWLSTTGLFRNTPNTTRITGQVVKTELRGKLCTVVGHVKIPR